MRVIRLGIFLLLAACTTVAPEPLFHLPDQPWSGEPLVATHLVTVTRKNERQQFQARLSLRPKRVLVVLLDGLGRRAATIRWTEAVVELDRADWFPADLDAERLLGDLVLAYWPEKTVRAGLAPGLYVTQDKDGRVIGDADGVIFRVQWPAGDIWTGTSHLRNVSLGYQMTVQSVREAS